MRLSWIEPNNLSIQFCGIDFIYLLDSRHLDCHDLPKGKSRNDIIERKDSSFLSERRIQKKIYGSHIFLLM